MLCTILYRCGYIHIIIAYSIYHHFTYHRICYVHLCVYFYMGSDIRDSENRRQTDGSHPQSLPSQLRWHPVDGAANGPKMTPAGFEPKTGRRTCGWPQSKWLPPQTDRNGSGSHAAAAVLPKLCDGNIKGGPWSAKPSLVNWTHIGIPTCSNHCQNDPGVLCCQWFDSSKVSEILLDGTEIHMTYCFFFPENR